MDFIEGILLLDLEGVEVCAAYDTDTSYIKETPSPSMYVNTMMQSNSNLKKLQDGKIKSFTLFYEAHMILIENWENTILFIYSKPNANYALMKQVSEELKTSLGKLNEAIGKIN